MKKTLEEAVSKRETIFRKILLALKILNSKYSYVKNTDLYLELKKDSFFNDIGAGTVSQSILALYTKGKVNRAQRNKMTIFYSTNVNEFDDINTYKILEYIRVKAQCGIPISTAIEISTYLKQEEWAIESFLKSLVDKNILIETSPDNYSDNNTCPEELIERSNTMTSEKAKKIWGNRKASSPLTKKQLVKKLEEKEITKTAVHSGQETIVKMLLDRIENLQRHIFKLEEELKNK